MGRRSHPDSVSGGLGVMMYLGPLKEACRPDAPCRGNALCLEIVGLYSLGFSDPLGEPRRRTCNGANLTLKL